MLTMPPNRLPCILDSRTRAVAACTAPPGPTWLSYPGSARRPRRNDLNSNDSKQDAGESGADERPENRYAGVTPVRRALACDRQQRVGESRSEIASRIDRITCGSPQGEPYAPYQRGNKIRTQAGCRS